MKAARVLARKTRITSTVMITASRRASIMLVTVRWMRRPWVSATLMSSMGKARRTAGRAAFTASTTWLALPRSPRSREMAMAGWPLPRYRAEGSASPQCTRPRSLTRT